MVVEDDPKSGFDEPKVFADPNEKSPGVVPGWEDVVVVDDAGVEPKLKVVPPGLKVKGAESDVDDAGVKPKLNVVPPGLKFDKAELVVVELEGLELADEKLKVDVGAADERLELPVPKDTFPVDSLDGVILLLPPLPKLKLTFGPSNGVVTGKDGLDSSPVLKLTNVDVFVMLRLDGVSDLFTAFLAFLFASSSS